MKLKVSDICHFTQRNTTGWQRIFLKIDFFLQFIHQTCTGESQTVFRRVLGKKRKSFLDAEPKSNTFKSENGSLLSVPHMRKRSSSLPDLRNFYQQLENCWDSRVNNKLDVKWFLYRKHQEWDSWKREQGIGKLMPEATFENDNSYLVSEILAKQLFYSSILVRWNYKILSRISENFLIDSHQKNT